MRGDTARLSRTWPRAHARSPVRCEAEREKKRKRVERESEGGWRCSRRVGERAAPCLLYFGGEEKNSMRKRAIGNRVSSESAYYAISYISDKCYITLRLREARSRERGKIRSSASPHSSRGRFHLDESTNEFHLRRIFNL